MDAYKGYHQIPITEKDKEKMVFYTREGLFCYKRLPFGLKNAGATYQRLIDKVFRCQVGRNKEHQAEEMVIKSRSEEEMLADIRETLKRLRVINLKLNPKKCSFGSGRIAKWAIELGEHEFEFKERNSIKGQILADFLAETPSKKDKEIKNKESKRKEPEPEIAWKLFTDEASSFDGS
nr:hypothetical protein [Tanacetum cinerariifolium]